MPFHYNDRRFLPPWAYPQAPQFANLNAGGLNARAQRVRAPQPPFVQAATQGGVRPFAPPGLGQIPSVQRFSRLAPSEQQGYTGYLEDELGLHAPDVFFLMNRLRPRGSFSFLPRWVF